MSSSKDIASRLGVPELAVELALSFYSEAQVEYAVKRLREEGRIETKYEYELRNLFGIYKKGNDDSEKGASNEVNEY